MSKFSRQQMRKAVERERCRRQGVQEDVFTTMGLHLAMYALHRKFGSANAGWNAFIPGSKRSKRRPILVRRIFRTRGARTFSMHCIEFIRNSTV